MAYKVMPVYNTNAPVGQGEPNMPDDVRLVQKFLVTLAQVSHNRSWIPATPLLVDGCYSPNLREWILAFQRAANSANPGALKEDGKVHPMRMATATDWSAKFGSGRWSTMYAMNTMLRQMSSSSHDNLGAELGISEVRMAS